MSYGLLTEAKGIFLKSKIIYKIVRTSFYQKIVFTISPRKLKVFDPSPFGKYNKDIKVV